MKRPIALACIAILSVLIMGSIPLLKVQWDAYKERRALQVPPLPATDQEQLEIISAFVEYEISRQFKSRLRHPRVIYFDPTAAKGFCQISRSEACSDFKIKTAIELRDYVDSADQPVPLLLQLQLDKLIKRQISNPATPNVKLPIRVVQKTDFACLPGQRCKCRDPIGTDTSFLRTSRAAMSPNRREAVMLTVGIYCDLTLYYNELLLTKSDDGWKVKAEVLSLRGEASEPDLTPRSRSVTAKTQTYYPRTRKIE